MRFPKCDNIILPEEKAKSIGVSNFSINALEILLPKAEIIPATNQVCPTLEMHVYLS